MPPTDPPTTAPIVDPSTPLDDVVVTSDVGKPRGVAGPDAGIEVTVGLGTNGAPCGDGVGIRDGSNVSAVVEGGNVEMTTDGSKVSAAVGRGDVKMTACPSVGDNVGKSVGALVAGEVGGNELAEFVVFVLPKM